MTAVEFESTLSESGHIALPSKLAEAVPVGQQLRVVVMWEPYPTDAPWRDAGRRAFEVAYCAEDAVYEQLLDNAPAR